LQQPVGDDHTAATHVHAEHRILRRRDEVLYGALTAHPNVVGRPLQHLLDDPDPLAGLCDDGEADDLPVIEATILERSHLLVGHLEVPPAEKLRDGPVLDPAQLDHQARLTLAAPLHLASTAVEEQACSSIETILEVCQGGYLDS